MDYSMYLCPKCKKVYKVKGIGKTVKCTNCDIRLLDMDISIERWQLINQQEKKKHIFSALNKNKELIQKPSQMIASDDGKEEKRKTISYIYCCTDCKLIEKHEKMDGMYLCSRCGRNLTALYTPEDVWSVLDKENKQKVIANHTKGNNTAPNEKSEQSTNEEKNSEILNGTKDTFSFFGKDENVTQKTLEIDNSIVCPECNRRISKDFGSCPNCGFLLSPKNASVSNSKTSKITTSIRRDEGFKKKAIMIGVIVVVASIILGCGYMFRDMFASSIYLYAFGHYDEGVYEIGRTFNFEATIRPKYLDTGKIKWTSSDENVATVEYGVVEIVGNGTCTITAQARNGVSSSAVIKAADIMGDWNYSSYSIDASGEQVYEPYFFQEVGVRSNRISIYIIFDPAYRTLIGSSRDDTSVEIKGDWEYESKSGDASVYSLKTDDGQKGSIKVYDDGMIVSLGSDSFEFIRGGSSKNLRDEEMLEYLK